MNRILSKAKHQVNFNLILSQLINKRIEYRILSSIYINTNKMPSYQCWGLSLRSLPTIMHQLQRCQSLYFFQMSQNWVQSVLGLYFSQHGSFWKTSSTALFPGRFNLFQKRESFLVGNFMKLLEIFKRSYRGVLSTEVYKVHGTPIFSPTIFI